MLQRLKVLVVDDSPIFRNAIVAALNKEERVTVVGSVSDGKKALEFITTSGDLPDLITLDVEMPNMDGL
jgi:two-component system chemotaxis response regulator CheB